MKKIASRPESGKDCSGISFTFGAGRPESEKIKLTKEQINNFLDNENYNINAYFGLKYKMKSVNSRISPLISATIILSLMLFQSR